MMVVNYRRHLYFQIQKSLINNHRQVNYSFVQRKNAKSATTSRTGRGVIRKAPGRGRGHALLLIADFKW